MTTFFLLRGVQLDYCAKLMLTESHYVYRYFEKGFLKKMCTRQSRKVVSDMINTFFLTLELSNPLLLAFL